MIYYNLKTSPFIFSVTSQPVKEEQVIKALENCYRNTAFSTFPYILYGMNSKQAIQNFKSGNCIALAMYLQNFLHKTYGYQSFLIPATIPNKYSYPGYLDISHVALAIPINSERVFIADPAFYFLHPITATLEGGDRQIMFSKSIYQFEPNVELRDYRSIEHIVAETKQLNKKLVLNQYQEIPVGTYYSECYHVDTDYDKWRYYLTEVINPDKAISTFFINIRNKPFITTSEIDPNGVCREGLYLRLTDRHSIKLDYQAQNEREEKVEDLKTQDLISLNHDLYHFLGNNLKVILQYLENVGEKEYQFED
jgi:hypothetical protein